MAIKAALSSQQALEGRKFQIIITGRSYVNGSTIEEQYEMTAEKVTGEVSLAKLLDVALSQVAKHTSIPADLVDGINFKFEPDRKYDK